jgi:hypothetical protein
MTAQLYQRPTPLDYDGVKHGRVTRKMTQARIPATARVIMAEVFRDIPVGTWGRVSHRTLARRLDFSESTISRGMDLLVHGGFVDRRPRADGPGYEICPMPPPELRPKLRPPMSRPAAAESPAETPQAASFYPRTVDHYESIPPEGVETPKNEDNAPVTVDGPIFYTQTCSSSMQGALAPNTKPDSPPQADQAAPSSTGNDLPPAPPPALAGYFLSHQWRQLCKVAPAHYGISDLAADVLKLKTRPDLKWPWKVLAAALERREPIYTQAEIDARDAELRALASKTPSGPPRSSEVRKNRSPKDEVLTPETIRRYTSDPSGLYRSGSDLSDGVALDEPDGAEPDTAQLLADLDEAQLLADLADLPPAEIDAPDDAPPPAEPPAPPGDVRLAEAIGAVEGAPPDRIEQHMLSERLKAGDSPTGAALMVKARRERAAWLKTRQKLLRGGT